MTATLSRNADCVAVRIDGKLGYDVWKILRDAREAARHAQLPLWLDVRSCSQIDMAGIGAVMVAQERLSCVELRGCQERFVKYFQAFGICDHCSTTTASAAACPRSGSH